MIAASNSHLVRHAWMQRSVSRSRCERTLRPWHFTGSLAFEQVGAAPPTTTNTMNGRRGDAIVMRKRLGLDLVAEAGEYGRHNDEVSSSA